MLLAREGRVDPVEADEGGETREEDVGAQVELLLLEDCLQHYAEEVREAKTHHEGEGRPLILREVHV